MTLGGFVMSPDDNSELFRFKSEKLQMLSASGVDKLVTEIVSPRLVSRGFEQIDRRRWVRSKKPQIREMVSLIMMKGLRLSARWGFSLDFVPHVAAGRIRWHRTARTAIFDLVYDPYDYTSAALRTMSSFVRDVAEARRQAEEMATGIVPDAEKFFSSVRGVDDLPQAVEEKRNRDFSRFGFLNYVQEPLAYAFVLAKTGELRAARKCLEIAKGYHDLDKIETVKLEKAFEAIDLKRSSSAR